MNISILKNQKRGLIVAVFSLCIIVFGIYFFIRSLSFQSVVSAQTSGSDWTQFQHDAQRTGRTSSVAAPNYRPRWVWFGPNRTLRNKLVKPGTSGWDGDFSAQNLNMPTNVPFNFPDSMQPIIVNSKVFVGDSVLQKVWAINLDDGTTLWEANNPGGTLWSGVATTTRVVFGSLSGKVRAWDTSTGNLSWEVDTGKSISSAPALSGTTVIVSSQSGYVYAIDITNGSILWKTDTGAPITSSPAVFQNRVYVGNESLTAFSLSFSNGQILAQQKLLGQSFRNLWPVGVKDRIIFHTVPLNYIGSEYAYNGVIDGSSGSYANEQQTLRNRLSSDMKGWQHIFALKYDTLSNDYVIPLGPVGGVGYGPDPVVLNQADQPITWWPTYFATLGSCSFGCANGLNMDLRSFDLNTGNGVALPGKSGQLVISSETDNTFGLTIGGNILFARQDFRGTWALDFSSLTKYSLSSHYRYSDCGGHSGVLIYANGFNGCPDPYNYNPTMPVGGGPNLDVAHVGPAIVDNKIVFTEHFAVSVIEHY